MNQISKSKEYQIASICYANVIGLFLTFLKRKIEERIFIGKISPTSARIGQIYGWIKMILKGINQESMNLQNKLPEK